MLRVAHPHPLTLLSLCLLLVAAGCSHDPGPGGGRGGMAGPRRKAPAPMAGQENFFAGRILAEIHVGTEGMPDVAPRAGGGGESRERRRGGGQMSIAGGGGAFGGNISGGVPFGGGGEGRGRRGPGGGDGGPGPRVAMPGSGRPVMIHLRFTNLGEAAVTLHIDDFVSPLGNFAVRPEKLVLDPGQSLETEPMASQLGGEFAETDATLRLRLGTQGEKKTFRLKPVAEPKEQPK